MHTEIDGVHIEGAYLEYNLLYRVSREGPFPNLPGREFPGAVCEISREIPGTFFMKHILHNIYRMC